MRLTKRIIIRIIVAVSVAVILSKLKLLNIIEVSALDYSQFAPSSTTYYFNSLNNGTTTSTRSYNIFGTTFWGYALTSPESNVQAVSFNYTFYNQVNRKDLNATFLLYVMGANSFYSPTKVYIQDDNKNVSYCEVQNSNVMLNDTETQGSGYPLPQNSGGIPFQALQVVNCKNVLLTTNYKVFVVGPWSMGDGSHVLSSPVLFFRNNEIETRLDNLIDIFNNNQSTMNDIKNNTKETNDLIKDDSTISNSKITDITNIDTNTSNTPVSDFITLPVTLLGKFKDGMNSSCSPVQLGSLLGTNLTIPCINIQSYLGENLWSIIDMLCSLFMVYNIAMLCVTIWEGITSLHDDFYGAYSPQHGVGGRVERGEMGGLY